MSAGEEQQAQAAQQMMTAQQALQGAKTVSEISANGGEGMDAMLQQAMEQAGGQ